MFESLERTASHISIVAPILYSWKLTTNLEHDAILILILNLDFPL